MVVNKQGTPVEQPPTSIFNRKSSPNPPGLPILHETVNPGALLVAKVHDKDKVLPCVPSCEDTTTELAENTGPLYSLFTQIRNGCTTDVDIGKYTSPTHPPILLAQHLTSLESGGASPHYQPLRAKEGSLFRSQYVVQKVVINSTANSVCIFTGQGAAG